MLPNKRSSLCPGQIFGIRIHSLAPDLGFVHPLPQQLTIVTLMPVGLVPNFGIPVVQAPTIASALVDLVSLGSTRLHEDLSLPAMRTSRGGSLLRPVLRTCVSGEVNN